VKDTGANPERFSNGIYNIILDISYIDWMEWQGVNGIVLTRTKNESLRSINL